MMFGPRSLSHYLFYVSRFAAIGSLLLLLFILTSLVTENYTLVNGQFQIPLPLFPNTFIKGFLEFNIITTIALTLLFFTVFFYLLSKILKTFKAPKLFSSKAIKQLNYFAFLNLVVSPALYLAIHFFIMDKSNFNDVFNLLLSLLLGIFVLFVRAVFKEGHNVQIENDLTI
jgi:hypothetical protein